MTLTELQASRRQGLIGAAVGLACGALVGALYLLGTFATFDLRLLDWMFRVRGERDASRIVAIVPIDDATIRAYGGWPVPRDQYALLLTALGQAGARAVGVDLQLPEDVNHEPRHNALLALVSAQESVVVHAVGFLPDVPDAHEGSVPSAAKLEALRRHGTTAEDVGVPTAPGVALPYDELMEQAGALGHITVVTDRDGAVRRQPQLVRYEDQIYPSLALRMMGVSTGRRGPPRVWRSGGRVRAGWANGPEWTLPLDREGATALDFAGDRGSFTVAISMIDVLRAYQRGDLSTIREAFGNRFVLVGLDSRTEVSEDVGTTPFAATTPLLYIHANAVENLLRHRFLTRPAPALYVAVLLIAAAALGWLFGLLPLAAAAGVAGLAVLAIGAFELTALTAWGLSVPSLTTMLLPPLAYAGVASSRFLFLESRSKAREADIREGRSVEQQFLPEALIGHDLSRYRVVEKLGRGGMGVVYRASDPRLHRDVAIKVLPGRALADERSRRRFRREAVALSKLNHPHIAGILDFDTQDGTDFLVMEYVRGTPLIRRIRQGALPESEAVRIMREVAEGLAEAHGQGVIHRDLKPENIMLGERGAVKVLDFGLALFLEETTALTKSQSLTEAGHMVGTLPYMAPEVLRGGRADPRSDLYSLGVVGFEMATGRKPFNDDETHELLFTILNQAPPPPRIVNGRISPGFEAVILRLLSKCPEERYVSALELVQALRVLSVPAAECR